MLQARMECRANRYGGIEAAAEMRFVAKSRATLTFLLYLAWLDSMK